METIYTIPINEAFESAKGCPVCTLNAALERESLEYILGPAMMEPDIRIETNKLGFCEDHLTAMLSMQKRLSFALILQTHLQEMIKHPTKYISLDSCYVCKRVKLFLTKYYSNILYLHSASIEFRALYNNSNICLKHLSALCKTADKELHRKDSSAFTRDTARRIKERAASLESSVDIFCKSFDHRFTGINIGEDKRAVEMTVAFLTGDRS